MASVENRPVVMAPAATEAVEEHCFSRVDVEVGGFLIGVINDAEVEVRVARPALAATSEQTHLTFTHEAWNEILTELPQSHPGQVIVGWYHSHPGFGCFLSDYDIFIQDNFFSAAGQHALVVDPIAGTWARFVTSGGASTEIASGSTEHAAIAARSDKADVVAMAAGRRRSWPVVVAAALCSGLVVGALAWFLGSVQGQDAATAAQRPKLQEAQAQVAQLQAQLAAAQPVDGSIETGETDDVVVSPSPAPVADQGLAIGGSGLFVLRHTIESGDTLWDLANRYFGDPYRYRELLRANPGVRATGLEPGQVLDIPLRGKLKSRE